MTEDSITPGFWDKLTRVRSISRLTLDALETEDIDEVERLSRESDVLMGELRPIIEARAASKERTEDDALLKELLIELKTMNDRILEEVTLHRDATQAELGVIRESRLRLVHYRSGVQPEPAVLDTRS